MSLFFSNSLFAAGARLEADEARFADGNSHLIIASKGATVTLYEAPSLSPLWSRTYQLPDADVKAFYARHPLVEGDIPLEKSLLLDILAASRQGRFIMVSLTHNYYTADGPLMFWITDRASGKDVMCRGHEELLLHGGSALKPQISPNESGLILRQENSGRISSQSYSLPDGHILPVSTVSNEDFPARRASACQRPAWYSPDPTYANPWREYCGTTFYRLIDESDGRVLTFFEAAPSKPIVTLKIGRRVKWSHNLFGQDGASVDWTLPATFSPDGKWLLYAESKTTWQLRALGEDDPAGQPKSDPVGAH